MTATAPTTARPGRNEPCHCGSAKKYKHCCLSKDETQAAAARAENAVKEAGEPQAAETAIAAPARAPKRQTEQPWRANATRGFAPRSRTPRKVGGS
jgi:uncharacterized protein YecA (UPF0149 family)